MTGRGLRVRAPVSYNDKKDSMEPAWLKKLQTTHSSTPPKKSRKPSKSRDGSAEKENSKESKIPTKAKKMAEQQNAEEAHKPSEPLEKAKKGKKSQKPEKATKEAARGRNAGVTVVPIVDKKDKAPKVAGLHKQASGQSPPQVTTLPKGPVQPKEVPGLPGIVQKAVPEAPKPVPAPRPVSAKRSRASMAASPKVTAASKRPPSPLAQVQAAKKQRHEHLVSPATHRAGGHETAAALQTLPPSPEPCHLSPLPPSDIADQLDEMRAHFASMANLCTKLQEENAELKSSRIRDDVEEVIAQQTTHVLEHGRKASELAQHWKDEAERMAELVEQLRGGVVQDDLRSVNAELATARQALLDMDISCAQREKALVELQKRNKFLERHARVPNTEDKCVGTDPPQGVNTWVQAPHGMEMMQARAFVPEGAAGSSLYISGPGVGIEAAPGHVVDESYTLHRQRTVPFGLNGSSDMHLDSQRRGLPGTGESVLQRVAGSRRMPAPAAPLVGPDGMPRQIQFYSTSGGRSGGLDAVPEEEPANGASIVPGGEPELLAMCGMIAASLPGGRTLYTHPFTGFRFEIGLAPPDTDDATDVDSVRMDLQYRPIAFGTAHAYIASIPDFGEFLLSDFQFASSKRLLLMRLITEGLAKVH